MLKALIEDIYAIEGSNPRNGLQIFIRKAGREPESYDFEAITAIYRQEFKRIFDTVVTGDDVKYSKPCPDPFLKAVNLLKVRREECIIIENAILGVEAAKNAEIYCIGIPTYLEPSQLDSAYLVIDDHKKLIEYLLSLEPTQWT